MINLMTINGVKAVITYDSDIDLFRGEFVGLNGGADFYAADAEGLRREGAISLKVFMDACQEDGVAKIRTGLVLSARFLAGYKDSSNVKTFGTGLKTPSRVVKISLRSASAPGYGRLRFFGVQSFSGQT